MVTPKRTGGTSPGEQATRLDALEVNQKLMLDKLDNLSSSVGVLREKGSDMESALSRFTTELRKQTETMTDSMRLQQNGFADALGKEADARKAQAEEFRKTLDKQAETMLETLKAAVFKTFSEKVFGWFITFIMGIAFLAASYFWTHMKSLNLG